jgi:hypothetical protein
MVTAFGRPTRTTVPQLDPPSHSRADSLWCRFWKRYTNQNGEMLRSFVNPTLALARPALVPNHRIRT